MSEAMVEFNKRVLMVGFGSVAQCTLPILVKHLRVPLKNITVLDFEDQACALGAVDQPRLTFVRQRITRDNLGAVLGQYLEAGDLLIDLAWNIDCCELLDWCHHHGVLYINTSVEVWDPYDRALYSHPTQRTLYWRHQKVRRLRAGWSEPGPTAVLEHGANPGLISHFTKQALLDIGERLLADKKVTGPAAEELSQLMADRTFNQLAMKLGVKVIHCSERDTQISDRPKQVDEFVNTWSVEGFREEGTTTAEMGWGTHEKELPPRAYEHRRRPAQPDLPGADGHEHLGPLLGAELRDPRHGRPPRRGLHDLRPADRLGGRQGDLSADRPLCLLPVRCGHRIAERVAGLRLRAAAQAEDHERRDHQRRRHLGAC